MRVITAPDAPERLCVSDRERWRKERQLIEAIEAEAAVRAVGYPTVRQRVIATNSFGAAGGGPRVIDTNSFGAAGGD